jgi:hypothetical protein
MNHYGPRNEEIVTWHPPLFIMTDGNRELKGDTSDMKYLSSMGWYVLSYTPGHYTRKWKYPRIPGDG